MYMIVYEDYLYKYTCMYIMLCKIVYGNAWVCGHYDACELYVYMHILMERDIVMDKGNECDWYWCLAW